MKVLVVEGSDKARQALVSQFRAEGYDVEAAAGGAFVDSITGDSAPDLILCNENLRGTTGKEVIKLLRSKPVSKQIPVLLMVGTGSRMDQLRIAMEAGANDAVDRRAKGAEVSARVRHLLASRNKQPGERTRQANTVTIVSARGGSGKTLLACNLAVAIAQFSGETVALLDLNLEFGTTATLLNLQPNVTLSQIAQASIDEPSDEAFDSMLLHHPSGVRLLPALAQPGDSELLKDEMVVALIERLRRCYDHLIIDGRPSYREFMIELWDHSDSLVVPCPADVPSVSVTRALLSAFERVEIDREKVVVVVNNLIAKSGLTAAQIEHFLDCRTMSIPFGGELVQNSVNRGRPYILDNPEEPTGVALRHLADTLLARYASAGGGLQLSG